MGQIPVGGTAVEGPNIIVLKLAAAFAPFEGTVAGRVPITSRYRVLTAPGESTTALHLNLTRGFPYDNRQFRQAVATALDRQDMVERLLLGRGEVASAGNMANSHPMLAPGLPAYGVDVARSASMLDALGIRDVDGDGMRELPDGQPFQLELFVVTGNAKAAELMKEYLRAVGLDLQIKSADQVTHDSAVAAGNYQMALVNYGGLGGDPDWLRQRLSLKIQARTFLRVQGFDNARFEELAAAQLTTTDVAQRTRMVHEMQRIVADELPVLALTLPTRTTVMDTTVFDAWYYTPGAVFGLVPGIVNKHVFVTGKKIGF
jgi:peptide/nickel transport system substrate-binding protein